MTDGFGHPNTGDPETQDGSCWWLDDESARTSRPSEVAQKLERLRADVAGAPDLSARILGQAGREEVFVPRATRRNLRLARWGAAAAACLVFAGTVALVTRTPVGERLTGAQKTPVADLVAEIADEAETITQNVRALPGRSDLAERARSAFAQVRVEAVTGRGVQGAAHSAPLRPARDVARAFCVDHDKRGVNGSRTDLRISARVHRLPAPALGPAPLLGTGGFGEHLAGITIDFRAAAWAYMSRPRYEFDLRRAPGYDQGIAGVGHFGAR